MTLRQWYKGMAMQALVNATNSNPLRAKVLSEDADREGIGITESTVKMAAAIADAMVAEDREAHDDDK